MEPIKDRAQKALCYVHFVDIDRLENDPDAIKHLNCEFAAQSLKIVDASAKTVDAAVWDKMVEALSVILAWSKKDMTGVGMLYALNAGEEALAAARDAEMTL